MEAENGKEFNPAPSKQIPQAFAFSFWFLNVNPSVASVTSVANKFLIFLSFILFPFFGQTVSNFLIYSKEVKCHGKSYSQKDFGTLAPDSPRW
jgi:hypothetical protein